MKYVPQVHISSDAKSKNHQILARLITIRLDSPYFYLVVLYHSDAQRYSAARILRWTSSSRQTGICQYSN